MKHPIQIHKTTASRIDELDFNDIGFGKVYSDHMFIADYENGEWGDCRILPYGHISLSPATSAIHYGQSIFEGMKAFKSPTGQPQLFRPDKNITRLNISAKRMAMPELPAEIFWGGINEIIQIDHRWIPTNSGSSLYIRPYMFATDEFIGVKPAEHFRFMIITCPVGPYYPKPVKVKVADHYVRAVKGGVGEAKAAGNYAATMLAVQEARDSGYDQILWMDALNFQHIQEVGTMNIFFQIGDTIVTPDLDGAILDGVTRDSVITLLKDMNVPLEIRKVNIQEIRDAYQAGNLKDVFGTGTAATIAHVSDLGYKDENMALPAIEERTLSLELKRQLEAIKTSKMDDRFGWIKQIELNSPLGNGGNGNAMNGNSEHTTAQEHSEETPSVS